MLWWWIDIRFGGWPKGVLDALRRHPWARKHETTRAEVSCPDDHLRSLEELVHRSAALILHVLEDVSVPPLRVIAGSEWPSSPSAPLRDPVGVNRGIKSPAELRKPFIYGPGGLGRPVS